jgi:serine/threonine protein kinase
MARIFPPKGHISGGNYRHLLDEYELGRVLGKGHFATVRLARHAPSLRMCALKVRQCARTTNLSSFKVVGSKINRL